MGGAGLVLSVWNLRSGVTGPGVLFTFRERDEDEDDAGLLVATRFARLVVAGDGAVTGKTVGAGGFALFGGGGGGVADACCLSAAA